MNGDRQRRHPQRRCGALSECDRPALFFAKRAVDLILKIGRANDRMRLRSGFRNALMLPLFSEKGTPASTRPMLAFNPTLSTLAITGHKHRSAGIANVLV
jgi:hypothetical protein